jgi:hypothetical protein
MGNNRADHIAFLYPQSVSGAFNEPIASDRPSGAYGNTQNRDFDFQPARRGPDWRRIGQRGQASTADVRYERASG